MSPSESCSAIVSATMGPLSSPKRTVANRVNATKPRTLRLTSALTETMCEAIRAGVRPEVAAAMNGIPSSTYFEWMAKAREPDARPLLRDLRDSVEIALAVWEAGDALLIGKAARQDNPGEWAAAAWRLERRLPSVYGKRMQVQQEITHEVIVTTSAWEELASRMLERLAAFPDALAAISDVLPGAVLDGEIVAEIEA